MGRRTLAMVKPETRAAGTVVSVPNYDALNERQRTDGQRKRYKEG